MDLTLIKAYKNRLTQHNRYHANNKTPDGMIVSSPVANRSNFI